MLCFLTPKFIFGKIKFITNFLHYLKKAQVGAFKKPVDQVSMILC